MSSLSTATSKKPTRTLVNSKINLFQQHAPANKSPPILQITTKNNPHAKSLQHLETKTNEQKTQHASSSTSISLIPQPPTTSLNPSSSSSFLESKCNSNLSLKQIPCNSSLKTSKLNASSNVDLTANDVVKKMNYLNVTKNCSTYKSMPLIINNNIDTNEPFLSPSSSCSLYLSTLNVNNNSGESNQKCLVIKVFFKNTPEIFF
jgi:hypothetical protein